VGGEPPHFSEQKEARATKKEEEDETVWTIVRDLVSVGGTRGFHVARRWNGRKTILYDHCR
jgi:hypothetical protein